METLKNLDLKGKRVLVRADFNVPLLSSFPSEMMISDDFRIKESLPTIDYLIAKGAKVILMSHLGRPNGRVVEELSLRPVQEKLMEYLDLSLTKADDCIGPEIEKWTKEMMPGEILLLENLRFHKEEEGNDDSFARELAKLGDIFVNDAFGASHRSHASIVGVPKYLPGAAGLLLEKEIKVLTTLMENPQKPLVAIIGGAKVETKTKVIDKMAEKADAVLIGGLIKKEIDEQGIRLKYPGKIVSPLDDIEGKDIGPQTIKLFKEKISLAKTVFFNGVVGMTEEERFTKGTEGILKAIIESGAFSVVGGGETVDFINKIGLIEKFNHVSTGGGAMLEFLSGTKLPGIEALR